MRRILLDQNVPLGLRKVLIGYDVQTAYEMGWDAITNGRLIAAAENAGFSVMVTSDQNIEHQQNLSGLKLALVVLTTNRWTTVRREAAAVLDACNQSRAGTYIVVPFPLERRRRRPPPPAN